ncbi:YfhO family protein [Mycoplasmatota bacterium]|nr:YfhO family protein [Mycoplasmatota bacterium]
MKKIIDFIKKIFLFLNNFFENKVFNSRKNTLKFLIILVSVVLFLIQVAIIIFNNSVYNNGSDDILQYYVIMEGFIRSVKEGSLSLFDLNNYFGASFFSNLYYVPLDIFTLLSLVLSFILPTLLAISTTELIKIIVGVFLVGLYLSLKKFKTKTIFWVGLIYFVNGGTVSFMNFPAFLSMTVYLPLALIVIHFFFEKKYWIVPLFVLSIVFYNFYLAYMVLAFISFAFIIEYFKYQRFSFKSFFFNGVGFLSLLLLGVLMSSVILLPAITFISEETIRTPVDFKPWIVNLKYFELQLFQPEVYIRYFAKMYSPQRPVSFRGFLGDYKLEHVSNYVTIIGFLIMTMVFFMRGKIALVYKIMFGVLLIFALVPFFSTILSGTFIMEMFSDGTQDAYPYNRWLNMVPLLQVLVIAHVVDHYDFNSKKKISLYLSGVFITALGIFMVIYYGNHMLDEGLSGFVKESLRYDRIFMMITLIILLISLILVIIKKLRFIKLLLFAEIAIAVGYMLTSAFGSVDKLDTFSEMNDINDYINENISDENFTRVFVDLDEFDVQDRNFNQMTSLPTNTRIFHSWSDAETDDLAFLMFPNTHYNNERQSKIKMNYYSYYLSSFLGYKYILTSANENSISYSSEFDLVSKNDRFALYKIEPADSFYVQNKYISYDNFKDFAESNLDIVAERVFLMGAIIDQERYVDIRDYGFERLTDEDIEYDISKKTINPSSPLNVAYEENRKSFENDSLKDYYVYNQLDIDFSSGEVSLRDGRNEITNYGEVYYINEKNEEIACQLSEYSNGTIIQCGQFFSPIKSIYIEKTSKLTEAPNYRMRLERAYNGFSYLVYDLDRVNININNPLLKFTFTNYSIQKNFIVDSSGNEIYSVNGLYYPTEDMKRIYIFKSSELYNHDNLFGLYLYYTAFEPITEDIIYDKDIVKDKSLKINNGKIELSYQYNQPSVGKHIITIPVTYSDDWQFTSDEIYDKISVSGGFLGIIVPEGKTSVDITMKFIPKNLESGLYISLFSTLVFLSILGYPIIKKRLKRSDQNDES